ncbi:MAG: ATP-binding protein [Prevotella sp.]
MIMAQGQADALMKMAQDFLAQKEYTKARSAYLQAYKAYASASQYDKATVCGAKVASLYYRENFYKEAFDMLRATDQLITVCEQNSHKSRPDLRYTTTKERLQMYTRLRKAANAKEQLARLDDLAKASAIDSLHTDLLYTKASHHYTFGQTAQGDAAINLLIGKYKDAKQYDKVIACYQTLIDFARKSGNAAMTSRTYEQYIIWKDSVRVLKAQDELAALKRECADKQTAIDDRDSSLARRQYIIVGLCILAAVLAATLVFGGIVLMRFIVLTRKQKKAIEVANENNELKATFIRNISAQLSPTLDRLDGTQSAVAALKDFMGHIGQLSELEAHMTEPCDMQEKNIATFCDGIAKKMEGKMKSGVKLVVNAPRLSMAVNAEMLEHVLLHLLHNAAYYTPEGGKITLDYKKRGAHPHQFIVTDTGPGIDADKRPVLFKPFASVGDLTQGDGLGLPICALMAIRMNGTLTLDESHTKSARFVLELHT